jgi:hypothetical protein
VLLRTSKIKKNDNQDVVDAPVGNVTDRLFDVNESHDVVDDPVGDVPDDIGAVENIKNQEDIIMITRMWWMLLLETSLTSYLM